MKIILLILLTIPSIIYSKEYTAKIIDCHDGDTVYAIIDLGLGVTYSSNVRLVGIDAPELKTGKPGKDATEALKKLVLNMKVKLVTNDKKEKEKYGRILGTIFVGDLNVNKKMIEDGHAKAYD